MTAQLSWPRFPYIHYCPIHLRCHPLTAGCLRHGLTANPQTLKPGADSSAAGLALVPCNKYGPRQRGLLDSHLLRSLHGPGLTPDLVQHGLGLTAPQLAWPLSCAGATLVCFALLVYPPLQRRVGPHKACRLGLACAAPCVMLVPTTSLLPL